jgi:hypothetical protein
MSIRERDGNRCQYTGRWLYPAGSKPHHHSWLFGDRSNFSFAI